MAAPKNTKNENKLDMSLLPMDLLSELVVGYEEGLVKYYRESWREGFKYTEMYASAQRHLTEFMFGKEDFDPGAEELGIKKNHLIGALFSIVCMLDTFHNHPELDDRGKDHKPDGWGPEMMKERIAKAKHKGDMPE